RVAVGVLVSFIGPKQFVPLFLGLDYAYVNTHHSYRISLDYVVQRAKSLGLERVLLGFGAPLEKKRFGAKSHTPCLYVQSVDNDHAEILAQFMIDSANLVLGRAE
ncbi:MAG TPA: hypothetical protein V6C82_09885, partial [Chroococcales cyanobacterium]